MNAADRVEGRPRPVRDHDDLRGIRPLSGAASLDAVPLGINGTATLAQRTTRRLHATFSHVLKKFSEALMITALVLTVSVIILGDTVTTLLQLPVPGPIVGLICTTVYFARRGAPEPAIARMFDGAIVYAPLLFVPAGVGVVEYLDVIMSGFWAIACVITLGTAATMLAAGLAMQVLLRSRPLSAPTSKQV